LKRAQGAAVAPRAGTLWSVRHARLLALAGCVLASGCVSVPKVSFFADDAGGDDGADATVRADASGASDAAAPSDATTGADSSAPDAGVRDATVPEVGGPDAGGPDAAGGICPDAAPAGAAACCGAVPCRGTPNACDASCTNCNNDCAGKTCCLDSLGNYHGCAATPSACE
jgi:hypothetical protein